MQHQKPTSDAKSNRGEEGPTMLEFPVPAGTVLTVTVGSAGGAGAGIPVGDNLSARGGQKLMVGDSFLTLSDIDTALARAGPAKPAVVAVSVKAPTKLGSKLKKVLVVEGEIGAGKTTLIAPIADELRGAGKRVAVALEPVALWIKNGILARFKSDPARYAYEFQTFTYVTRVQSVIDALEAEPEAEVLICERTIYTDRFIFMELQRDIVGKETMEMYEQWCGMWSRVMPVDLAQAMFVYLKPSLAHCMSRVQTRARAEELVDAASPNERKQGPVDAKFVPAKGGTTIQYQAMLRQAHEALFEGKHEKEFAIAKKRPFDLQNVLVIGGEMADADFSVAGAARDGVVAKILKFATASATAG